MSQEFDPYHRWLGIPPDKQPANHYRLLGLVCDHGKVVVAHVISDGRLAKSFTSEEEALRDDTARALVEKINDFESRYKKNAVAFRAQVKKIVQSEIGQVNSERREAAISRVNEPGAKQKAAAAAAIRAAQGR